MKEVRQADTTVWKTGVQCKSGSNTVRQQQILGVEEGPGFKGFAVRNPSQIHLSHSNLGEAGWTTSLLICCSAAKRGIKEKERRIFGEQFLSLGGTAMRKLPSWEPIKRDTQQSRGFRSMMSIPSHFSQSICGLGSFLTHENKNPLKQNPHLRPQNAANETKTHRSPSCKVNLAFATETEQEHDHSFVVTPLAT